RNDTALARGTFRVRGETLEIFPAYAETAFRIVLFGDEVEHLQHFDPLTGELIEDDLEHVGIWPASHYNVREGMIEDAVAQLGRRQHGDRSRKQTLGDYGFRLPRALDNRPQTFQELLSITQQMVFVSATTGEYERTQARRIVEQIVRPTGIVAPEVEVRETR